MAAPADQLGFFENRRSERCPFCFDPRPGAPVLVGLGDQFTYRCPDCGRSWAVEGSQLDLYTPDPYQLPSGDTTT